MKKYKEHDIVVTKINEWHIPVNVQFEVYEVVKEPDSKYIIAYNPHYGMVDFDFNEVTKCNIDTEYEVHKLIENYGIETVLQSLINYIDKDIISKWILTWKEK